MDFSGLEKSLRESGARWTAKRTSLFELEPQRRRVAGIPEIDPGEALRAASHNLLPPRSSRAVVARAADWRGRQPPIMGTVRDQSACNSCAAFAICSAMEARLAVEETGKPFEIDLSEADLFFCGRGSCASGMPLDAALTRARTVGVGLEADFPYDPNATTCVPIKPNVKAGSFHYIVDDKDRRLSISEDGPVVAVMRVFEDFLTYDTGIYEYVTGQSEGLHAVVIVGYDDDQKFWIVRNSWGSDFGEAGYFRIRYGQCEIDTRPFVSIHPERIP